MTIQEAQEVIKNCDSITITLGNLYKAVETIQKALNNGYQLCKVDEVIDTMNRKALDVFNDGRPKVLSLGTAIGIVKEGCK